MATRFKSLKLSNADLFGVALSGSVGRSDHKSIQDLANRILAGGKVDVVFDLTKVTSIGGGGVKLLAGFQEDLLQAGGEMIFVGASEVMREYLQRSFKDLPQKHFSSVAEMSMDDGASVELEVIACPTHPEKEMVTASVQDETGADDGLDKMLGQFKGPGGKRHHFVSLAEAVESLDFLASEDDQHRLTQALSDLLYGHDLADSVELLTRQEDCMLSTSGLVSIPCDGGIIPQIMATGRPMTILDLDNDVLLEEEISLLAEQGPDVLLPIIHDGELFVLMMLMNQGQERDYSVAETLALELLMQVISASVASQQEKISEDIHTIEPEAVASPLSEETPSAGTVEESGKVDSTMESTLLRLAEDLPVAEDADHFWTLFAKHTAANLGVVRLAFMGPDMDQANLYVGKGESEENLLLNEDRFQVYLRSLERPVLVENLPRFFSSISKDLDEESIQWIVSLNWEQEYLGAVLLQLDKGIPSPDSVEYLTTIIDHIARHMAHFSDQNNQHDLNLDVVRVLMGQREKRCFGSNDVTESMVKQVRVLAREMGFPPAQERDLIYGCLLRDIGLVQKDDKVTLNSEALDFEEQFLYRKHPADGALMLAGLDLPPTIVEVVQGHHERFNGQGYPMGQTGREIPLAARVVSVVEHYVFMITGAGGVPVLEPAEAAEKMRQDEEGRFDPDIVQVFLSAVQRPDPVLENDNKIVEENNRECQETGPVSASLSLV